MEAGQGSEDEVGRKKKSEAGQRHELEEEGRQRQPRVPRVTEGREERWSLRAARSVWTHMASWAQNCYEAMSQSTKAETLQAYAARKRSGCSCSSLTLYWRHRRQAAATRDSEGT